MCSCPVTTAASTAGGGRSRCMRTARERPDLIEARGGLTEDDRELLAEFDLDLP